MMRRKALLIGINYTNTQHALRGCHQDVENMYNFLLCKGFPADSNSMVILSDEQGRRGPQYEPTGYNILAAMDWLVRDPNTSCFLHYSGHGGQVRDPDGDRASGLDDTIVPLDFEENGQLDSDTLHRHLVSRLAPGSKLHVVLDCCHSGSAIELPYVYRTDEDGNVNLLDNLKQGYNLIGQAQHLIQGGFTYQNIATAQELYNGARSFFKSITHMSDPATTPNSLGEEQFAEHWENEQKYVVMYSGCRDDQTSADASIGTGHVGAMSWAFLETMKASQGNQTYVEILQNTRQGLQDKYAQVPQLSVGIEMDLNRRFDI